jgi:hypothetical protein
MFTTRNRRNFLKFLTLFAATAVVSAGVPEDAQAGPRRSQTRSRGLHGRYRSPWRKPSPRTTRKAKERAQKTFDARLKSGRKSPMQRRQEAQQRIQERYRRRRVPRRFF